jgi:hypothetical protein
VTGGIVVIAAAGLGCGNVALGLDAGTADGSPDGADVDGATDAPDVLGPWQTPVPIASVNTSYDDRTPWLSADGKTLYFASNRPLGKGSYDVWRAQRGLATDPFEPAENMAMLNSTASEERPFVAASHSRVWFSRTVGGAGMEIFQASGSGGVWSTATVVAELSSTANDGTPMVTANGTTMYMFSRRGANGDADVYVVAWSSADTAWLTPTTDKLGNVNTSALELYPHLSTDGLRLYLTSNRDGTYGVYVAKRGGVTDDFGIPQPIAELNTEPTEGGIWISEDERHMLLGRGDNLHESRR